MNRRPGLNVHSKNRSRTENKKHARGGACPDCGAGKKRRQEALGGVSYCMQCGHMFRQDEKNEPKT